MNLSRYYDEAYERYSRQLTPQLRERIEKESRGLLQLVDEIKEKFIADIPWGNLKIAELGSGLGGLSLILARRGAQVTVIDFAPTALEIVRQWARNEQLPVKTLCVDLGRPDSQLDGPYDIMIDSHLLHCLPLAPQRISYLQLVRENLTPQGLLVGESMVHRKKLYIPPGYRLDEDNILWQMFGSWVAVRKIADSLALEEEFKNAQLKIQYFYYYASYAIAPSPDFWDIPGDILPASVRFALKKT